MDNDFKPPYTVAERLEYIMVTRNLRQSDIIEMAKPYCTMFGVRLWRNDLSQYIHGKAKPKQDKCSVLAMTLNVSEPWLMGYDVPMERISTPDDSAPDSLEKEAETLFKQLTTEQKSLVIRLIRELLS